MGNIVQLHFVKYDHFCIYPVYSLYMIVKYEHG